MALLQSLEQEMASKGGVDENGRMEEEGFKLLLIISFHSEQTICFSKSHLKRSSGTCV
jgi:hypothetical protein